MGQAWPYGVTIGATGTLSNIINYSATTMHDNDMADSFGNWSSTSISYDTSF